MQIIRAKFVLERSIFPMKIFPEYMNKLLSIIQLIRPFNCLITFLSIGVMAFICSGKENISSTIILASITGFCVAAAGNIINDILDYNIDRINRPDRVLPLGKISIRAAYFLFVLFCGVSIILSFWINLVSVIIVLVSLLVLYLYSSKLKKIALLGNLVVSLLTALAFVFAGAAVGNIKPAIVPAVFAFLINFVREIVKDMEDVEGDRQNNISTFPLRYGFAKSQSVILSATIILILFTFVPFILQFYKIEYFIIVTFVNIFLVYFIKSIRENSSRKNLSRMSTLLKVNMILGLAAIYMGI